MSVWLGERTETEREVFVEGVPARLYASSGPRDEYVEIVMPADWNADAAVCSRLAALSVYSDDRSFDAGLIVGPPAIVTATTLRVGGRADDQPSTAGHLAESLRLLATALPGADFGDLLPRAITEPTPSPATAGGSAVATDSAIVTGLAGKTVETAQSRALPPTPGAEDLLERARAHAAKGQMHKASRLVDEALRLSPRHLGAIVLRDRLAMLNRREKRRQREPRSIQAHLEVGVTWLQLGCDSLAVAAFRDSVRVGPTSYLASLLLGIAHHHGGRVAEAGAAYAAAGALRPLDPTVADLVGALARGEPPPLPVEDDLTVRAPSVAPQAAQSPARLHRDRHLSRTNDRRRGVALLQA